MDTKIDTLFSVKDRVVAITGAAGVIYGCLGKALAENGAKVALLDIMMDKANEVASEIKQAGGDAIAVECNVLEPDSIQAALDKILETYGTVDVLVNGAGGNKKEACVPPDGKFTELDLSAVDFVFALNYKGTFMPSQIFCKYFAEKGEGCIVNTSSMCSFAPLTNVPGYSNAKAAVTNFTQWLSVQVKVDYPDANIRVNEIAPGFLDTTQNHHLLFNEDDTLTVRGESIIDGTPQGRFGDPEELVGPLVLLMSDAGSFLNGITLAVDGGFAVYSGVGPLDEKKSK